VSFFYLIKEMMKTCILIYFIIALIIFIMSVAYVCYNSTTDYKFILQLMLMSLGWPLLIGNVITYIGKFKI